jgi:hypothetical protein
MASKNAPDTIGQHAIREAADRVVDSVLLKSSDRIPDVEEVRELRAAVEQQINELIFSVRDYVSQISQQSLPPTYSPGQLAKNFGITVDKVLNWIRNGQIDAIDVSTDRSGRPRYRIDVESIAKFKAARNPRPPPKPTRRNKQSEEVLEFF